MRGRGCVRACGRAGVRACGRAGVWRAWAQGVISWTTPQYNTSDPEDCVVGDVAPFQGGEQLGPGPPEWAGQGPPAGPGPPPGRLVLTLGYALLTLVILPMGFQNLGDNILLQKVP